MRGRGAIAFVVTVGATGAAIAAGLEAWRNSRGVQGVLDSIGGLAEYWDAMIEANEGGAAAIQVAVLGDSASQGVGGTSPETGWVPQVAAALGNSFDRPVEVWNFSVSGAIASEVLDQQVPKLEAMPFEPDLVIVEVGANDVTQPRRVSAGDYLAAMEQILRRLPAGSFVADPPSFARVPYFARRARQFTDAVRPLISQYGHILLPLFDSTKRAGLSSAKYLAPDFFHPNDRGYVAWAESFIARITEAGWSPRARAY